MRFLFLITAAVTLGSQAYACENGSSDCAGWGVADPIVVKVGRGPPRPSAPNPPPRSPTDCHTDGSSGTCASAGVQTEGGDSFQNMGDVKVEEASLVSEEPPSGHSFTLPVAFTFHNYEQCTNDISAKAPEDGGVVHLPEGVSIEVFCRRLFPFGTSQTQVNTLQVTFTADADQCESNLTTGLAPASGAVSFPSGENATTYCQGIFGESAQSNGHEPAAGFEIENSKL